jgi:hypothetical protein
MRASRENGLKCHVLTAKVYSSHAHTFTDHAANWDRKNACFYYLFPTTLYCEQSEYFHMLLLNKYIDHVHALFYVSKYKTLHRHVSDVSNKL